LSPSPLHPWLYPRLAAPCAGSLLGLESVGDHLRDRIFAHRTRKCGGDALASKNATFFFSRIVASMLFASVVALYNRTRASRLQRSLLCLLRWRVARSGAVCFSVCAPPARRQCYGQSAPLIDFLPTNAVSSMAKVMRGPILRLAPALRDHNPHPTNPVFTPNFFGLSPLMFPLTDHIILRGPQGDRACSLQSVSKMAFLWPSRHAIRSMPPSRVVNNARSRARRRSATPFDTSFLAARTLSS